MVEIDRIKIAYVMDVTWDLRMRGAQIQMLKYKEYLEKLYGDQIKIYIVNKDNFSLKDVDIVHYFGLTYNPIQLKNILSYKNEYNYKVVVSTIFWWDKLYSRNYVIHLVKLFLLRTKQILKIKNFNVGKEYLGIIDDIINDTDMLLPNTLAEARLLRYIFEIDKSKIEVIPNGVDPKFYYATPDYFVNKFGVSNFLLYVGSLNKRKNVLRLLKAFLKSSLRNHTKLVIIGGADKEYDYARRVIDIINNNKDKILWINWVKHADPVLESAYAACDTFVLPSYVETPGLAALEAALAGAKIVITKIGGTKEYFRNYALYVNPLSISDIKEKIEYSYYNIPKTNKLREFIYHHYTWDKIAHKLFRVYKKLV